MFAGIIEAIGKVVRVAGSRADRSGAQADGLEIEVADLFDDLNLGASVAVNGVCLTLTDRRGMIGGFDIVPETWRNTNLQTLRVGHQVNLERSLRVGDRIDGHFVQGHVDGVGRVSRLDRQSGEWKMWIAVGVDLLPYIVRKGSLALDGTSLTVVDVEEGRISVVLIPTTLERTVLSRRRPGDLVNVETDILARLVLSRLAAIGVGDSLPRQGANGITLESLQEGGFL